MSKKRALQTSTIAWTAYNWLAYYAAGPRTLDEIRAGIEPWIRESKVALSDGQFRAAIEGLLKRKYFRAMPGDSFDLVDPQRRILVSRSRGADPFGWEGWQVAAPPMPRGEALDRVVRP